MNLYGLTKFMAVLVIAGGISGAPSYATRVSRIELAREVSIAGKSIFLSDLLPTGAPPTLRDLAEKISLGAAPQPGNIRTLGRAAVVQMIGTDQTVLLNIEVPDRMTVTRSTRSITVDEVFEAIRVALRAKGWPAIDLLRPEDILFGSQIIVSAGDPGLRVLRMEVDHGLQRVRFLLWASQNPHVLPFFVTARLAGNMALVAASREPQFIRLESNQLATIPASKPKREILVTTGERATLTVRSDTLRIVVDVIALQRGTLGEQIRVRMVDTGKITNAWIDGRAHLAAQF